MRSAVIYPHAVLYRQVSVGDRSIVHAGVVLGADGFGYVWDGKRQAKVPQVGGVNIGQDVEIGANSTVDRATAGTTSQSAAGQSWIISFRSLTTARWAKTR